MTCAFCGDEGLGTVNIDGASVGICPDCSEGLRGKVTDYRRGTAVATPTPTNDIGVEGRQMMRDLAIMAGELQQVLSTPLAVDNQVVLHAIDIGVADELREGVRRRVVAAVLNRLGKALVEKCSALRAHVEEELVMLLMVMDTPSIRITGGPTLSLRKHTATSFNKEALTQKLLTHNVPVWVVEAALKSATTTTTKDIVDVKWQGRTKTKE